MKTFTETEAGKQVAEIAQYMPNALARRFAFDKIGHHDMRQAVMYCRTNSHIIVKDMSFAEMVDLATKLDESTMDQFILDGDKITQIYGDKN